MGPSAAAVETVTPFQILPVKAIRPSPLNPRKHFDQVKLEELAQTMGNGVGVIEPLVVRATPKNGYELVAGERRWRAAQIAGLDEVPTVIKVLTDPQVLEIMVIENDQREDINALEEGDGFKRLMTFGFDIDKLAARIGRSRKYVYDRVKLLDLIPLAKKLLLDGRITPGHAILLARLTPGQQANAIAIEKRHGYGSLEGALFEQEESLLTDVERSALSGQRKDDPYAGMKAKSVRELEAWIAQHCRFDVGAPVNVELFPQTAASVEEAEKVVSITHNHHVDPDAKEGHTQRIYSPVSWKRADGTQKSKTCTRSVTGVIVVGPGRGEAFKVCVHKECDVHWGAEKRAKARAATSPAAGASWQARRDAEQAKYKRQREEREARAKAWEKATPAIAAAVAEKVRSIPIATVIKELFADLNQRHVKEATALLPRRDANSPEIALRILLLASLVQDSGAWNAEGFTKRVKGLLGLDVAPLLKVQTSAKAKTPVKTDKTSASKKSAKKR